MRPNRIACSDERVARVYVGLSADVKRSASEIAALSEMPRSVVLRVMRQLTDWSAAKERTRFHGLRGRQPSEWWLTPERATIEFTLVP